MKCFGNWTETKTHAHKNEVVSRKWDKRESGNHHLLNTEVDAFHDEVISFLFWLNKEMTETNHMFYEHVKLNIKWFVEESASDLATDL